MERENVGEAIRHIIHALDIIVKMANDPATYEEVAAEERALWAVKCRAELLTSRIRGVRDTETKFRVVQ